MTAGLPRRVLMTADSVGGVWTYALQLCEELARYDVEVVLVAFGGAPDAGQQREAARLSNIRLVASDLRLEWMPDCEGDLQRADELLRDLAADTRPDLVHVNGYAQAAAGFTAPVVVAAHSCVTTWWRACRGETPPPEWEAYEWRLRAGLARASATVAPSRSFLRAFVDAHGPVRAPHVIRNGRDPARYEVLPKRHAVLAAGRLWDEAKNVAAVCAAARRLPCPVLLAGDGNLPELPENVQALGRLDAAALAAQMGEAAIFVAPARYEPFGLAVLEAALSGCALVLGDIPTFRELWDGACRFAGPRDPDALADTLRRLIEEPEQAALLGKSARRRALRYSARAMGRGYCDLYRDVLAGAAPRRRQATEVFAA